MHTIFPSIRFALPVPAAADEAGLRNEQHATKQKTCTALGKRATGNIYKRFGCKPQNTRQNASALTGLASGYLNLRVGPNGPRPASANSVGFDHRIDLTT